VEKIEAKPAETSVAPVDFANASPFPQHEQERDRVHNIALAITGVAILTFLASMIAVLAMHGSGP
jgi:hypothetical protein